MAAKKRSIKINGKRYMYDRGRYKEIDKVGSVSQEKGNWLKRMLKGTAPRGVGSAIGTRAEMLAEIDKEISKQYKR